MGKVPQGWGKFQKFLYHRNQREKVPVRFRIYPNWSHNSSGKCVLKFSFWRMKNHKLHFFNFLNILISEFIFLIQKNYMVPDFGNFPLPWGYLPIYKIEDNFDDFTAQVMYRGLKISAKGLILMQNHMTKPVFRNSKILHFLGVKSEIYHYDSRSSREIGNAETLLSTMGNSWHSVNGSFVGTYGGSNRFKVRFLVSLSWKLRFLKIISVILGWSRLFMIWSY